MRPYFIYVYNLAKQVLRFHYPTYLRLETDDDDDDFNFQIQ